MKPKRLSSISVIGLFGRFHHSISFSEDENLLIITAPNGYGKTIILRIIYNFFSSQFQFFWNLQFSEIRINFSDGEGVRIIKQGEQNLFNKEKGSDNWGIIFEYTGSIAANYDSYEYSFKANDKFSSYIERYLPVHRAGRDRWMDFRDDTHMNTRDLIEKYADLLPAEILKSASIPNWLQDLTSSVDAHLIETQRLLSLELEEHPRYGPREGRIKSETVVEKDAEDLSGRIVSTVNRYATEAQKLDQTFPKRIIEHSSERIANEKEIRARLESLSEKRENLFQVGLIGESVGEPISPADDLSDDNIRRILSIYVSDTEQKLSVFDDLYERVRLFINIINEHFLFKAVSIDQDRGIFVNDLDSGQAIKLSDLSSGEQHELVLIYELLFKVEKGSIILIDEPELSLHVAWQKTFISDIQKIQDLRDLQFIIATHSPQIINYQWDLVQELAQDE